MFENPYAEQLDEAISFAKAHPTDTHAQKLVDDLLLKHEEAKATHYLKLDRAEEN